jgi:hypothetical protein
MQIYITGEPNERVQMDICGPLVKTPRDNVYILVITDMFTKYTEAYAMPDQTAETVADRLVKGWIKKKGPPVELHTDQGANFQSKLIAQICETLNIKKTRTTAYHPQGDGQVERFNKSMIHAISKMMDDSETKDRWDILLDDVVASYNATVHATTNYTPNYLWYGRELRFTIGNVIEKPEDKQNLCDYVLKLKQNLAKAYDIARFALKKKALEVKNYHDRNANLKVYKPGEKVMIDDRTRSDAGEKKFQQKYTDPWFVLKKLSPVVYRIQQTEEGQPKVVGHNSMEKYNVRHEYVIPDWVIRNSEQLREKFPGRVKLTAVVDKDSCEIESQPTVIGGVTDRSDGDVRLTDAKIVLDSQPTVIDGMTGQSSRDVSLTDSHKVTVKQPVGEDRSAIDSFS